MQGKMLSIGAAALGVAAVLHGCRPPQPPPPTPAPVPLEPWTDQLIVVATYFPGDVKLQGETGDWDLANWQTFVGDDTYHGVFGLDVSPDASKIIAGMGIPNRAIIWDASSGEAQVLGGDTHTEPPRAKFFPDGQQIATSDFRFRIWNADTNAHIKDSASVGSVINALAVFPDNIHVAGATYGKWVMFNTQTSALQSWAQPGHVVCVDVFPDGERVATGGYDSIPRIWTVSTGAPRNLEGHTETISAVKVFSNGAKMVSGSYDDTAIVWDAATASLLFRLTGHTGTIWGIDLFQNEDALATTSTDGSLKIWDTATWALVKTVTGQAELRHMVIFRDTTSQPNLQHNCAVDAENTWPASKKAWCCRVDHRGCPPTAPAAADVFF